jgi:hypothetical protein
LLREYADRTTGYIYADEIAVLRAAADELERLRVLAATARIFVQAIRAKEGTSAMLTALGDAVDAIDGRVEPSRG